MCQKKKVVDQDFWATPAFKEVDAEKKLPILTNCLRLGRKEPNQERVRSEKWMWFFSRSMRISWSKVSKAADRSKVTKAAARPLAQILPRPSVTCRNIVSVEWCLR